MRLESGMKLKKCKAYEVEANIWSDGTVVGWIESTKGDTLTVVIAGDRRLNVEVVTN